MGPQARSQHQTTPNYGFGTSTREHSTRVFISRMHAESGVHDDGGPGPAGRYSITGSFGQRHGLQASKSYQFGTDSRFKYEAEEKRAMAVPGPGAYSIRSGVGMQNLSTKQSGAAYGFGSGDRRHAAKVFISSAHALSTNVDASPGPATVGFSSSFGKSMSTMGHTGNSWSFGKAGRFDRKSGMGADTPGPGSYGV